MEILFQNNSQKQCISSATVTSIDLNQKNDAKVATNDDQRQGIIDRVTEDNYKNNADITIVTARQSQYSSTSNIAEVNKDRKNQQSSDATDSVDDNSALTISMAKDDSANEAYSDASAPTKDKTNHKNTSDATSTSKGQQYQPEANTKPIKETARSTSFNASNSNKSTNVVTNDNLRISEAMISTQGRHHQPGDSSSDTKEATRSSSFNPSNSNTNVVNKSTHRNTDNATIVPKGIQHQQEESNGDTKKCSKTDAKVVNKVNHKDRDATVDCRGSPHQPEESSRETKECSTLTKEGNSSKDFDKIPSNKDTASKSELHRWLVVLGCFMCNFITGGIDRSDGIFYLKFLEVYKGSALASSWAVSLPGALRLLLGPVSSALSERFSARSVVITGGFLLFISFLATGFSPSLIYIYITFGLIGGVGRSFIYTPGLVAVGQYFAEKPGLAVGVATSGVGAGTFALPPLVNLLFEEYQYWEVFTCIGLICLNAIAFGSLLRPQGRNEEQCCRTHRGTTKGNKMKEDPVQLIYTNYGFHSEETPEDVGSRKCTDRRTEDDVSCDLGDTSVMDKDSENILDVYQHNELNGKTARDTDTDKKASSTSAKFFDFSLLSNSCFVMFCVSILLFTSAFRAAFTFLPALAESRGCTNTEAALLMSVAGIFDAIGRILCGYFLDLKSIRNLRPFAYSVILLFISCTSFACPFMFGFLQFALLFGFYGSMTGAYVSQKSVVLVDILGVEKLSSSFGLLLLSQGFGSLIGPPLSGFLMDTLGNYGYVFYLGGGMMAGASVVMVISNILLASQRRRFREVFSEDVNVPSEEIKREP